MQPISNSHPRLWPWPLFDYCSPSLSVLVRPSRFYSRILTQKVSNIALCPESEDRRWFQAWNRTRDRFPAPNPGSSDVWGGLEIDRERIQLSRVAIHRRRTMVDSVQVAEGFWSQARGFRQFPCVWAKNVALPDQYTFAWNLKCVPYGGQVGVVEPDSCVVATRLCRLFICY